MSSQNQYAYFSQDPQFPTLLIVGTLFLGAFFGYLNETLLNVALSHIQHDFHVDKPTVQWLTTGFMLIMGAFTPITASLVQRFHTRRIVLLTLGTFIVGSLICALAMNFSMLLLGRLVQAISAAMQMPLFMNALLAIYPPEKRGRAMSLVAMTFTVAPAIGPTLSGFIVDHFGWHQLFLFPAFFMLLAMLVVAKVLKMDLMEIKKTPIDALSAVLAILGFGALIYAASQFSHLSLAAFFGILLAAMVIIGWFCHRQLQLPHPLLELRVFRVAQFRYAVILLSMGFFTFLGLELLLPMYSQQVLLLSGTVTGLMLLPASITEAIFSPLFGYLLDKKDGRWVLLPGAINMLLGMLALWYLVDLHVNVLWLSAAFCFFAISVAAAITGETHGLNNLPQEMTPHGTAILSTLGPIAGALGAAFFVGVTGMGEQLSMAQTNEAKMLDGVRLSLSLGVIFTLISLYFSCKIQGKKYD